MKQKRWILIIIGLLILIGGGVSAINREAVSDKRQEEAMDWWDTFRDEAKVERVIRAGDKTHKIVVLPIEGTITSNSGMGGLLADDSGYNQQALLKAIDKIKADDTIKGVILEVDSPGGGTYASVEMYDALKTLKEEKKIPIYVNMKATAASGAYMISMAADKIYAHPETITGSIGVIMENLNYKKFLEDHGVKYEVYKSGKQKDMGAPFKDPSDEDKKIFQSIIDESYNRFVADVAEGRHLKVDQVKKLADGRVYTAKQAKENGLIDEIGDQADAIDALMADNDLNGAQVEKLSPKLTSWDSIWTFINQAPILQRLMGADQGLSTDAQTVQTLLEQSGHPTLWSIYGGVE